MRREMNPNTSLLESVQQKIKGTTEAVPSEVQKVTEPQEPWLQPSCGEPAFWPEP